MANILGSVNKESGYNGLIEVFNDNVEILNNYLSVDTSYTIRYGFSKPDNSIGEINDLYIEINPGEYVTFYSFDDGHWTTIANLPDFNAILELVHFSSYIFDGIGKPSNDIGTSGDLYINVDTTGDLGDLYRRNEDGWACIGNIRGGDGKVGPMGLTGPQGERGLKGDKGDKGDKGEQGEQGSMWLDGPGEPSENLGRPGDRYLQLDDSRKPLYVKVSDNHWERSTFLGMANTNAEMFISARDQDGLREIDTAHMQYNTFCYVESDSNNNGEPAIYFWSSAGWQALTGLGSMGINVNLLMQVVGNMIKYKVDSVPGKTLSENDFTDEYLEKVEDSVTLKDLYRFPENGEEFELVDIFEEPATYKPEYLVFLNNVRRSLGRDEIPPEGSEN